MKSRWEKILVIGAGGTGSLLLTSLVRFLYSQEWKGKLIVADGDAYSESNIARQNFALEFTGMNKAEYQYELMSRHIPGFKDNLDYIPNYLSKENIAEIVDENTIVINCADNKAIRKYVEDRIEELNTACHVCCGNEMKRGQVQVSLKLNGKRLTPNIYHHFPELNDANDDRSTMNCQELANLPSGGQIIGANMMCASFAMAAVIKLFSDHKIFMEGKWYPSSTITFDIFTDGIEVKDRRDLFDIAN